MTFKVGDQVWYRPQRIGHGYFYGIDFGIPAEVLRLHETRCTIVFLTKDGVPLPHAA